MDALSPAAAFAKSLKTYDNVTFGEKSKQQTCRAVVNFDENEHVHLHRQPTMLTYAIILK